MLPDSVAEDLGHWVASEKNKETTLAAFLVEAPVRQAKDQGLVSPDHETRKAS